MIAILNAMTQSLWHVTFMKAKVLVMMIIVMTFSHANNTWDNWIQLDENYLLQWNVRDDDIIVEMQVRTHGYVGFGLSRDGTIFGADVFISWIDDGHKFFYDCHIKTHTQTSEPVVDTSQDYELLSGLENATHTILKFQRKLNTCDDKSDVPITNDTMNIIFLYSDEKPKRGQFLSENLPNLSHSILQIRSLLLLQRSPNLPIITSNTSSLESFEILNSISNVTSHGLLKWCHSYRITHLNHHIVRHEPSFSSPESKNFINLMRLYECKAQLSDLRTSVDIRGECSERLKLERKCHTTVALWTKGSDGFTYPDDVGYPLSTSTSDNFLLEIHYQDIPKDFQDSSGFRIFHTSERRKFDAGSIAMNIRPNFLHIIAPGYKRVVSIGHCTSNCTKNAFPWEGINVFGIIMQTHSAGTMIKVNLVRNGEELEPLAQDSNLNSNYIETRRLNVTRTLYQGDHLMVECTYNSFKRERFTLGGESSNEEICMANIIYYPRQEQLVMCNSQSKISDVLRALGIEELGKSWNQTFITKPDKYAGRTLEKHLELYDWKNEFYTFERIIKTSSFDGYCHSAFVATRMSGTPAVISKPYRPPDSICYSPRPNKFTNDDDANENSIDEADKSKEVRSPSTLLQQTSSTRCNQATISILILLAVVRRFIV